MAADTGQGNGVRAGAATRADAGAGQRRARSACVCAIRVSWLFQRRAAPATGPCSLSDRAVPTQRDTGTDSCTGTAARRAQRRDAGLADGVGTMSTTPRGGPLQGVQIGRAPSELQSLMRISYSVFCLKTIIVNSGLSSRKIVLMPLLSL